MDRLENGHKAQTMVSETTPSSSNHIPYPSPSPAPLAGSFPYADELSKLGQWRQQLLQLPESPQRNELLRQIDEVIAMILRNIGRSIDGKGDDELIFGRSRSNFAFLAVINVIPIKRRLCDIDEKRKYRPMMNEFAKRKSEMMQKLMEVCGLHDLDALLEDCIEAQNCDEEGFLQVLRAPPISPAWFASVVPRLRRVPGEHPIRV